jgi:serine/threonine protein kinase
LKAENILLDNEGHIRLSDFGLSHQAKSHKERIHAYSGTATYMAPELLLDKKGKGSVDMMMLSSVSIGGIDVALAYW